MKSRFLLMFAIAAFPTIVAGQAPPLSPQPSRDPAIQGAIEAGGGASALNALRTYSATGRVTLFDGAAQRTGQVAIKWMRRDLTRVDMSLPDGNRSWVLRGKAGRSKEGQAKAVTLAPDVALSLRNYTHPLTVVAFSDAQVDSSATGASLPSWIRATPRRAKGAMVSPATEYELDASGRIIRVRTAVKVRPDVEAIQQEFVFADFRVVDGVLFPFQIEEWTAGQRVSRIQLETISTNGRLTLADFELE